MNKFKDKEWRINHLYKIVDKNKNKIVFKRNKAQEHYSKNKWFRNIILKSRQLGFTTDESIDMLDDVLFTPNCDCLLIAHTDKDATKIFDKKISFAWKNLNKDLRQLWGVDTDRTNELKFDFGDDSFSSISVSNSGRSGTFNRVHISEFAKLCKKYFSKAQEVITGTIPSVPIDGRVDIESTAEGEGGEFYNMFWEAWNRGEPKLPIEYKAHFYNWTWDNEEINKVTEEQIQYFLNSTDFPNFKDYQVKHKLSDREITYYYFKWISLNKDNKKLMQEYPTTPEEAFISSGNKLFDREKVVKQNQFVKDGTIIGNWIYYEEYIPGHIYALGADVGHGKGKDSSTINIMDFTPLKPKVVAEYACNSIEPDTFAYEVKNGARAYGNCLVAVENNDRGYATLVTLKGNYFNLYKRVIEDKETNKQTEDLGWNTNSATKAKMMFDIKTAVNDELLEIPSKHIIQEMKTYDEDDLTVIKFDDEQTNHWDRLTALAICWQMKTHLGTSTTNIFKPKSKLI